MARTARAAKGKAPRAAAAAARARRQETGGSPLEEARAAKAAGAAPADPKQDKPAAFTPEQEKRRKALAEQIGKQGPAGPKGDPIRRAPRMVVDGFAAWQQRRMEDVFSPGSPPVEEMAWTEAERGACADAVELLLYEAGPEYAKQAPGVAAALVLAMAIVPRELAIHQGKKLRAEMLAAQPGMTE